MITIKFVHHPKILGLQNICASFKYLYAYITRNIKIKSNRKEHLIRMSA
jgi:hypothetical protein